MKTILIPDHISNNCDIEKNIFGKNIIVQTYSFQSNEPIQNEIWENCDAILVWHHIQIDKKIIEKLSKCKVIVRIGVGFDSVDLVAAKEKGIVVCNVPDYGTNDVADHSIALMLSLARGLEKYNYEAKYNEQWEWNVAGELRRLSDSTMGIIGLGRIGTATALRAKAFGIKVVFYDPYVSDGKDKSLLIKRCGSLDELLGLSDIVSFHTPLTNETLSMANKSFFKKMKSSATLINTARGQIFNIDDLYDALKSDIIKSVGTDVLPIEPPEKTHPLIKSWRNDEEWLSGRLLITPHAAFYNKESLIEMREKAALEALRVLNGENSRNPIKI
jgi:lactate dehydrogenase-like 2-hydroxyacid dehydrogenase